MNVLVIIPAYNEEQTIGEVLADLKATAPEFDVIVVNDGSSDGTRGVVSGLGVKQIVLPCNLGYGRALQTGLKYSVNRGYEIVVFMDADGQHEAAHAKSLVDLLVKEGADVVIGSRFLHGSRYKTSVGRRIGMTLFSIATLLLTGRRIYDTTSGLKAMRLRACRELLNTQFLDLHAEMIIYLLLSGFDVREYPINNVRERVHGRSMYSWLSHLEYPLKLLLLILLALIEARLRRRDQV